MGSSCVGGEKIDSVMHTLVPRSCVMAKLQGLHVLWTNFPPQVCLLCAASLVPEEAQGLKLFPERQA